MVANEAGPGSFRCLSWQSLLWLVLPALELRGCQALCACVYVCACMCVHTVCVSVCVRVWFGLSKLSRDKCLSDPGLEFAVCFFTLITGCGRPGQSPPFWIFFFFLKSVFLLQPLGFGHRAPFPELQLASGVFTKRTNTVITHCVPICVPHLPCHQGTELR